MRAQLRALFPEIGKEIKFAEVLGLLKEGLHFDTNLGKPNALISLKRPQSHPANPKILIQTKATTTPAVDCAPRAYADLGDNPPCFSGYP